MNKGSWGKVRAFFDVCTQEGLIVKGFSLIDGINGLFVGLPSKKGKDEEWRPTVFADKNLMQDMLDLALAEYNNEPIAAPIDENIPAEVENIDAIAAEPYSEEDLPF